MSTQVNWESLSWFLLHLCALSRNRGFIHADETFLLQKIKGIKQQMNHFLKEYGLRVSLREDGGDQFCIVPEEFCLVAQYNSLDPEDYTLVFEDEILPQKSLHFCSKCGRREIDGEEFIFVDRLWFVVSAQWNLTHYWLCPKCEERMEKIKSCPRCLFSLCEEHRDEEEHKDG